MDTARTGFAQGFVWPARGRISGIFGSQRVLNGQPRQPHYGLDVAGPTGTPVVAAADGQVTLAEEFFFFGRLIVLDHGHGVNTLYAHLSAMDVAEGRVVRAGERIGAIGATGRVTGPHLHFSLSWYATWLDPQPVLPPVQG
jgi:murein DD-endopeptidase MepM/ murein hydrolase activator NlpD